MNRRLEQRQIEARERQALRAKRTAREQLKILDFNLGKGVGAEKERKKLLAQIAATK